MNVIGILLCLDLQLSPYKIYLETGYPIENFVNDWHFTINVLKESTWGIVLIVRIF